MAGLNSEYKFRGANGEYKRFNHEGCSSGEDTRERLYVTKVRGGWKFFCHNCSGEFSGVCKDKDGQAPSETLTYLKSIRQQVIDTVVDKKTVKLPYDMKLGKHIPKKGLTWLYSYGMLDSEIAKAGIGYSRSLDRLILPVYSDDNRLIYWQGRNLGEVTKKNPKYLNIRATGASEVFFKRVLSDTSKSVVLVEDILSAIKVGRHTTSVALLGSYINNDLINYLVKYGFEDVTLWLDRDKFGYAVRQLKRLNILYGMSFNTISTEKDPKELSDKQILDEVGTYD